MKPSGMGQSHSEDHNPIKLNVTFKLLCAVFLQYFDNAHRVFNAFFFAMYDLTLK